MKIKATYQTPDFPYFAGNPLIEALENHIIREEKVLLKSLQTIHDIPDDIFSYDEFLARDWIGLLDDIYIPHKESWSLYLSIIQQIKNGYRHKNPLSANGQKYLNLVTTLNQDGYSETIEKRIMSITGKARCSLARGLSGLGKTETITSVLDRIPQVIRHSEFKGETLVFDQLVWVTFDVASTNSMKGLATNFFRAVDEQLGTNYANQYSNFRESVDVFIGNMRLVCAKHAIGFVHVDECQHLLRRMKSAHSASVQDLESFFNRMGIPMLMTCTPEGLRLFFESNTDNEVKPRLQAIRRLLSERSFPFEPMDINSISFRKFFNAFLPSNVFSGTGVDSPEFRQRVHYLSFGIPAVAGRLMRLFFEAIHQHQRYLTDMPSIDLLDKVYEQHFEHMKVAINRLRIDKAQEWEMLLAKAQSEEDALTHSTNSPRTLHSSRRPPKMATEHAINRLEKMDELAACRTIDSACLTVGLSQAHE